MDASASSKVDAVNKDGYAYYLKIENTDFPTPCKQRSTVIKYTKLPEFENDSKVSWPSNINYSLQPRLRRIITLEEPLRLDTSKSLKLSPFNRHSLMATNLSNRKIVTISEDDEYDLHPKFPNRIKKSSTMLNKASEAGTKKEVTKQSSQKNTSRSTTFAKETRCAAKMSNVQDNKNLSKSSYRRKISDRTSLDNISPQSEKETMKTKSAPLSKTRVNKTVMKPSESKKQVPVAKSKLYGNLVSKSNKKSVERSRDEDSPPLIDKSRALLLEMQKKRKPSPVIHVPLEDTERKCRVLSEDNPSRIENPSITVYAKSDGSINTEIILHRDVDTNTELPPKIDQVTDMDEYEPHISYKCIQSSDLQASLYEEKFDKLDIPNVSLIKDKLDFKDEIFDLHSKSLPNLQIPPIKMTDNRKEKSVQDAQYSKSTSYIISRATLTYKTQQKINFHVVDSKEKAYSNQSPSPLSYPMSVVSIFKEEMRSKDIEKDISLKKTHVRKSSKKYKNCVNKIKSLNCSYVPNSNKLMKPSDVISTIRVNNSLLQSVLLCEQFQRELSFIDSFFESLQYLESCSISGRCNRSGNIDNLVNRSPLLHSELDSNNTAYESFLSKLDNDANSDDETIASKNLFLLNILIRDEQRRAKNLLCVLKRREDALKDFTKSQILYLENKKKQDNTDISALKKKQRGALLKLQHECGEMQRMRKALLALSEKRKLALMKTKKDLELKLKNSVDVEQIILEKKKLKRNTVVDRSSVPLKCFDLSSSGCEDSTTSRCASEGVSSTDTAVAEPAAEVVEPVTSAEKSIQTVDSSTNTTCMESATNTTDENLVAVDGGYLNILFHNLCLPQIFSGGKHYEVNQMALKNIVDSTNTRQGVDNWSDVVEKLTEQSKIDEEDKASTPSTARSLVEEFEQYYKSLADVEESVEVRSVSSSEVYEVVVQPTPCDVNSVENNAETAAEVKCVNLTVDVCDTEESCELVQSPTGLGQSLAGPLPVPAGAPHVADTDVIDVTTDCQTNKSPDTSCTEVIASSQPPPEVPAPSSPLEPTHAEAEELRRQQLAIEREIKELEQQSRLLVVREIPDKPPPPYTPPVETRPATQPRRYRPDDIARDRIAAHVTNPLEATYDPTDAFDVLVHDFCEETVQKHKSDYSDKPWDSCNLLPQKPPLDNDKLIAAVSDEICDVLTPATPSLVPGVSARRSDHIDDILFAEWRRAEPEWTSLHADEAIVKNQLFETIFQRILTETVDEYKRSVLSPPPVLDHSSLIM